MQKKGGRNRQRFCPSLPAREATVIGILAGIKALFQSTLPAREATLASTELLSIIEFQSTLPTGEATSVVNGFNVPINISIHASREGSDLSSPATLTAKVDFNPRFPRGERR